MNNHGTSPSIRLNQAKCLVGYQLKTFCYEKNTDNFEALVYDHRPIGLVERLYRLLIIFLNVLKKKSLVLFRST